MVIIGVERRVSGGWTDGNKEEVVKKCRGLWRTCGMRKMLRVSGGFEGCCVEIFCSTWNMETREVMMFHVEQSTGGV